MRANYDESTYVERRRRELVDTRLSCAHTKFVNKQRIFRFPTLNMK